MEIARITTFGIAVLLMFAALGLVIQYRYSELNTRLEVIETGYGTPPSVVGTAQITNKAITTAKLADSSVTTEKLGAAAVTGAKIADGSITAGDLATGAVTSLKILDGTIAEDDIADDAITSAKIAAGAIAASDIANSAVTSAKILDGTILTEDIANDNITSALIENNTVSSDDLADNIAVDNLYADNVDITTRLTIPAGAITDNTIENADIATGFIQSGWVDNTMENTAIIPSDNVGQPITVSFSPSFSTVPVVTISDNDENILVKVYDVTTSSFKVQLWWRLDGANITGVDAPTYDMYDNIRWIAMVPKQD